MNWSPAIDVRERIPFSAYDHPLVLSFCKRASIVFTASVVILILLPDKRSQGLYLLEHGADASHPAPTRDLFGSRAFSSMPFVAKLEQCQMGM